MHVCPHARVYECILFVWFPSYSSTANAAIAITVAAANATANAHTLRFSNYVNFDSH